MLCYMVTIVIIVMAAVGWVLLLLLDIVKTTWKRKAGLLK